MATISLKHLKSPIVISTMIEKLISPRIFHLSPGLNPRFRNISIKNQQKNEYPIPDMT